MKVRKGSDGDEKGNVVHVLPFRRTSALRTGDCECRVETCVQVSLESHPSSPVKA